MNKLVIMAAGLTSVIAAPVADDPEKDESGSGYRDHYELWDRGKYRQTSTAIIVITVYFEAATQFREALATPWRV